METGQQIHIKAFYWLSEQVARIMFCHFQYGLYMVDLNPFNAQGGLGKMWQLFGDSTEKIIEELNV